MNPLHENCQGYKESPDGKVIGVQLGIHPVANSQYAVYAVRLIDESQSQGRTDASCMVLDAAGIDTRIPVSLGFPWGGNPPLANVLMPGNSENRHVIVNKYWPPNVGPLALFVGSKDKIDSDIVWGLGLPKGHHVSYIVTFKRRGAPGNGGTDPDDQPLAARVALLEQTTKLLSAEVKLLKQLLGQWVGD